MILADDILAHAGGRYDATYYGAITSLAREVASAERFVLDRQTVAAVMGVSHSAPKSIMSARSYARAPFEKVWIEWRMQDVLDAVGDKFKNEPGRYAPDRVGCLLQPISDRPLSGMMTLAWGGKGQLDQSIFSQVYDMSEDAADLDRVARHFVPDGRLHVIDVKDRAVLEAAINADDPTIAESNKRQVRQDPSQLDYLAELSGRFDLVRNPRTLRRMAFIREREGDPRPYLRDWDREGLTVISALILLNSRDLAERHPVTQRRLNQKRLKRRKLPLQSHTLVRLGAGMGIPRGGSRTASKAHLVRGHFKLIGDELRWWSPHVRGKGKQAARSSYQVQAHG